MKSDHAFGAERMHPDIYLRIRNSVLAGCGVGKDLIQTYVPDSNSRLPAFRQAGANNQNPIKNSLAATVGFHLFGRHYRQAQSDGRQ